MQHSQIRFVREHEERVCDGTHFSVWTNTIYAMQLHTFPLRYPANRRTTECIH